MQLMPAGGGSVLVPAGTCLVSIGNGGTGIALNPRANVTLRGVGRTQSIIKLANYQGIFFAASVGTQDISGWSMYDLTVDQNSANNPVVAASNLSGNGRDVLLG